MKFWKSFGASAVGPAHIAAGMPNQDAWLAFHHLWGDGVVVSDGLGSKPFSDFGSRAACLAVARAAHTYRGKSSVDQAALCDRIKSKWLSLTMPLDSRDCAATCVFAFRINDACIRIGMLGDGLAAVIKPDGTVVTLSDDKSQGFSNITTALSASTTSQDWRFRSLLEADCHAIVLCTDGVADDLADVDGFVKEFAYTHCRLSSISAARRAREALANWPTPKHSDDKTIACLFREEVADE
jgi:serine/threonine protein phosphatase PrpC